MLQGKSVRSIASADFASIVLAGHGDTLAPGNARRLDLDIQIVIPATDDLPDRIERATEQIILNRRVRDANFRLEVCRAYGDRCAIAGLRIINGGGRSEVQAAHIRPVNDDGPDIVQNALALSATVHWLFDRHLISIGENFELLVSDNRVPSELRQLFRAREEGLYLPRNQSLWPHQRYLAHHREKFVSGTY